MITRGHTIDTLLLGLTTPDVTSVIAVLIDTTLDSWLIDPIDATCITASVRQSIIMTTTVMTIIDVQGHMMIVGHVTTDAAKSSE